MAYYGPIPIQVKKTCLAMREQGLSYSEIYNNYYVAAVERPQTLLSFKRAMQKWRDKVYPDDLTLQSGTYEGFVAHGATVQVSSKGEIVQAWIKQRACEIDPEEFIGAIQERVEPYEYVPRDLNDSFNMLEIPLFDMHWGMAFLDNYYEPILKEVLDIVCSHNWKQIVIPFGQDFFHNDSIVNGQTTKGTVIEKADMVRAVKDGKRFMYSLIDTALEHAEDVKVIYSCGNHDRSMAWMFIQVLLERYGPSIVDDSLDLRKVVTYGKNSIMVTHGDSKRATAKNLAHIFPITFPDEFANADIREVHAGHLHHEAEADIYGVMVRRLSTGGPVDSWSDEEDYVGTHKRFMIFEWGLDKLKSIHYI